MSAIQSNFQAALSKYLASTPYRVKVVDIFIVLQIYLAIAISGFVFVAGSFPFNSYLSALFASMGSATLGMALRMQLTNLEIFKLSERQVFGEYLLCCLFLHLACFNFVG